MQYMGGKARIAKDIANIIIDASKGKNLTYVEPFLGGCNVAPMIVPSFPGRAFLSDAMPDVAALWSAAISGWVPPEEVSRDEYGMLRHDSPSALRGFAGFGCSFGGKWFGGYASDGKGRDYCRSARRAVLRDAAVLRNFGARVACKDYAELRVHGEHVVYCDPPYAGTTGYSGIGDWDPDAFWHTADRWVSRGAVVFVSEYSAPPSWRMIWEKEREMCLNLSGKGRVSVERLFTKRIEG